MAFHKLKTWPGPFAELLSMAKKAEVRQNDRNFSVGDILNLWEYIPEEDAYTGRIVCRRITHIQQGFGLPDGLVVLSLD